ncbi:MAG: porin [Bacteroidia bacterium]|nr:porin [Bacteroidia bacterium]
MKNIFTLLLISVLFTNQLVSQETSMSNDSLLKYLTDLKKEVQDLKKSKSKSSPHYSYKSGLGFATPDSSYSLNIRFRIQNRFLMNTKDEEHIETGSWEARVRRCRLSFTGHIINPKWNYYLQLSFSRGDMDWSDVDASTQNTSPNVVRDAMIFYKPIKNLQLALGQGKLPGNRQRVISSGAQQFYDRSIVNVNFTPDRDFGFFANYTAHVGKTFTVLTKLAVTSGEGRNSVSSNTGLAYTGRIELLPLGQFTDGGDYYEGDLAREPKPKISIAGGYQLNDLAVRTAGQLGKDLLATRSFNLYMADFLFKYKGIALSSEYIRRDTEGSPIVLGTDLKSRTILTGDGINTQLSYCFKNMFEIALRHSLVSPHNDLLTKMRENEQYGLGVTKYLNKHKVKVQGNVFYNRERDLSKQENHNSYFFAVFQIELGI